ncbi:TrkA family potassium uptake protein [Glutamicibacter sp. MNS18]|uniref:potassium channel family protein n=1 Tax=Glutamicibacter sp. MNS18 TaxID=2989817 RepID=UPI0022355B07|nr:TrkA family potassium uptake protein [Glutamicibacter sp. MNS18]MCW4464472.1 TrkA family potassium uptake protein [Glutamicibacter sp. MNS18]
MKVMIAGAGSVGSSIARELLGNGHQVLVIDRNVRPEGDAMLARADWISADACELSTLQRAGLEDFDVVVSATGDDKANLVISLLAKSEFGIRRTVGRVNSPKNEWLFDDAWGVDVAVSTPRLMTALVEEAVEIGDLVRLLSLHSGAVHLMEFTVPHDSALIGRTMGRVPWPADTTMVSVIRDKAPFPPSRDDVIEGGDELFFLTTEASHGRLREVLRETAR